MRKVLLAMLLIAANGAPVAAACYDKIGCTDRKRFRTSEMRRLDCETLWVMRNTILAENGFCFADPRAAAEFEADVCAEKDMTKLPLNPTERSNFRTIVKVETEKGC